MTHFKNSIYRELKRFSSDRSLLLMTVIIPVVTACLYLIMFSKGDIHNIPIAVCDNDKTNTSRQIIQMLDATPTPKLHSMRKTLPKHIVQWSTETLLQL